MIPVPILLFILPDLIIWVKYIMKDSFKTRSLLPRAIIISFCKQILLSIINCIMIENGLDSFLNNEQNLILYIFFSVYTLI